MKCIDRSSQPREEISTSNQVTSHIDHRESTKAQLNQQKMMHSVVQKVLIPHKPKADTTSEEVIATYYAAIIDELVKASYEEFMAGNYGGASDAQIALYKRRKFEFDEAKRTGSAYTMHPSTAAGYVIEGKANTKILATLSNVTLQVADMLDGTRPDIVFKINDTGYLGMVDITASNSAGHIFSKKGNWTGHAHILHVSEAVYPSINFDTMAPIVLSPEDIQQIESRANEKEALKQEQFDYWRDLYSEVQNNVLVAIKNFNENNEVPFYGTETQFFRLLNIFRKVGLGVMLYKGNNQLNDLLEIAFEQQDGSDIVNKIPYKIDVNFARELISLLNNNNMTQLIKGNV